MNILFISKLSGNLWAGPNNSVPAQVLAQSKIDNVMWVNLNHNCRPEWRRREYQFINYDDKPNCTLHDLPSPFNKPDYIICEEIYCYQPFDRMIRSIMKSGVTYSIVPRSSLTIKAQHNHYLKKKIANFIFYNKFIRKSNDIQYLTNLERTDSEKCFQHRSFIIPNGTNIPAVIPKSVGKNGIKIVYVGRLEIYQKGLDLLVAVVAEIQDKLREAKVSVELYGPNRDGTVEILSSQIYEKKIDDIVSLKSPVFDKEKDKVLDSADVFIMTSRFEGMPMGLIEALGHGLPCIATEGTYLMDKIVSYNAGWGAGSTMESIKDTLLKMIEDQKNFSEKGKNARELATQYSWDYLAEILHNHIKDTV